MLCPFLVFHSLINENVELRSVSKKEKKRKEKYFDKKRVQIIS
jgi:hypothetical protein